MTADLDRTEGIDTVLIDTVRIDTVLIDTVRPVDYLVAAFPTG
jgi:hypothetical protein